MARFTPLVLLLGSARAFVTPTTRVRDTTLHAIEAEEIGDAIALQAFRALDAVVDGGFAAGDVLQNKVAPALAKGGDAAAETLKTKVVPALADGADAFQTTVVPAVGEAITTEVDRFAPALEERLDGAGVLAVTELARPWVAEAKEAIGSVTVNESLFDALRALTALADTVQGAGAFPDGFGLREAYDRVLMLWVAEQTYRLEEFVPRAIGVDRFEPIDLDPGGPGKECPDRIRIPREGSLLHEVDQGTHLGHHLLSKRLDPPVPDPKDEGHGHHAQDEDDSSPPTGGPRA